MYSLVAILHASVWAGSPRLGGWDALWLHNHLLISLKPSQRMSQIKTQISMVLQKVVWWSLDTLAVEAIEWCPRTGLCLGPLPHSSQELPIGPLQPKFSQMGMVLGLSFGETHGDWSTEVNSRKALVKICVTRHIKFPQNLWWSLREFGFPSRKQCLFPATPQPTQTVDWLVGRLAGNQCFLPACFPVNQAAGYMKEEQMGKSFLKLPIFSIPCGLKLYLLNKTGKKMASSWKCSYTCLLEPTYLTYCSLLLPERKLWWTGGHPLLADN